MWKETKREGDTVGYTVQFPRGLYERVKAAAESARQSIRAWVLTAAEQRIAKEEGEKPGGQNGEP